MSIQLRKGMVRRQKASSMNDRCPLSTWIPTLVLSAVLGTCFVSQLRAGERPSKPNIIIMMAEFEKE